MAVTSRNPPDTEALCKDMITETEVELIDCPLRVVQECRIGVLICPDESRMV